MKKIKLFSTVVAGAVLLSACDVEYPEVKIMTDPGFESSQLQEVRTVSIYDTCEATFDVSRTEGLSQEMELTLAVDPALLEEYNLINGTSYELLDASCYEMPEKLEFKTLTKSLPFIVKLQPAALVAKVGLDKANNMVLPVRIVSTSAPAAEGASMSLLVHPDIAAPSIMAEVPETEPEISFISISPAPQTYTVTARINFNTADLNKVNFAVPADAQQLVDDYNAAHPEDPDCLLLPESVYTLGTPADGTYTFSEEEMTLTNQIKFQYADIDDAQPYLLPLVVEGPAEYGIEKTDPIYVKVSITELRISVSQTASEAITGKDSFKGSVKVRINAKIDQDLTVALKYDQAKIAGYGGSYYGAFDESVLTLEPATLLAGQTSVDVPYTADLTSCDQLEEVYLAPLSIDIASLPEGTKIVEDSGTNYVSLQHTLGGSYVKTIWGKEYSSGRPQDLPAVLPPASYYRYLAPAGEGGTTTILVAGRTGALPKEGDYDDMNLKYILQSYNGYATMDMFFAVEESEDPNILKCVNFYDRAATTGIGKGDRIENDNSYYDKSTKTFHLNLTVFDSKWFNFGGFPIQVDLKNVGD